MKKTCNFLIIFLRNTISVDCSEGGRGNSLPLEVGVQLLPPKGFGAGACT